MGPTVRVAGGGTGTHVRDVSHVALMVHLNVPAFGS